MVGLRIPSVKRKLVVIGRMAWLVNGLRRHTPAWHPAGIGKAEVKDFAKRKELDARDNVLARFAFRCVNFD